MPRPGGDLSDHHTELSALARVQAGAGLVEEERPRFAHDGPRDAGQACHPLRKGTGAFVQTIG